MSLAPLVVLLVVILVVGIVMAAYPMDPNIKKMLYIVMAIAVIIAVLYLLFSVLPLSGMRLE